MICFYWELMGEGKKESEVGASEPALPEGFDSERWSRHRMDLDGDVPDTRAPLSKAMKELQRRWRDTVRIGEQLFTPDELVGCVVLDTNGVAIGVTLAGLGDKEERRYVGLVVNAEPFWKEEDLRGLGISGSMAASIESTIYVPMGQISEFRKDESELALRCSVSRLVTLPSFLRMNEIEPLTLHQWSPDDDAESLHAEFPAISKLAKTMSDVKKDFASYHGMDPLAIGKPSSNLQRMGDEKKKLQALREEIRLHLLEKAGGRPKYAYSNELLDEIVRIKPRSKSELRKIKGMGIRRMESSEDILEIIENWLMQRCMDSIQTNYQRIVFSSENQNLRLTPEELDEMSKPFVEWVKGRENSVKRISTVETKEEILELMADPLICNSNFQIQVSKLKDELRGRGLNIQPSRLSQIITSLVNDGLITREKPVPYKKGVVLLQLTEKGRGKMFDTKEPNQDSDIRHLYNE